MLSLAEFANFNCNLKTQNGMRLVASNIKIRDGYSKLRARGKDSQKLVFPKKKDFDLVFPLYLPKSW